MLELSYSDEELFWMVVKDCYTYKLKINKNSVVLRYEWKHTGNKKK